MAAFDPTALIERLERSGGAICAIVEVASPDDARWRPDPSSWSILEIICHLVDEELEDFRARVLSTLQDPSKAWAPIDPQGWATQRDYQSRDLDLSLSAFQDRRSESIRLLRALESPDWSRAYRHPEFGELSAGYMLSCWAAHDALHLRQLSRRLYQLALRDGSDEQLLYAGSW